MATGPERAGGDSFEAFVTALDYPMFVVTTAADGERAGCLVGFATQVSIHPPRFLVGLSDKNHTFGLAARATHLAVHLLTPQDLPLARLFGEHTGDDLDKFARCSWTTGPGGVPVLDGVSGWFVGRVLERFTLGDHVATLLEPEAGQVRDDVEGLLTLADVHDLEPGHGA
jgi:flavin reductase (DIM6/NTAB) family NADH-FMN oxidoreductase RutF